MRPKPEARDLSWVAGPDLLAHAMHRNRRTPALCGVRPWAERFDWPAQRKCPACQALAEAPIAP